MCVCLHAQVNDLIENPASAQMSGGGSSGGDATRVLNPRLMGKLRNVITLLWKTEELR